VTTIDRLSTVSRRAPTQQTDAPGDDHRKPHWRSVWVLDSAPGHWGARLQREEGAGTVVAGIDPGEVG